MNDAMTQDVATLAESERARALAKQTKEAGRDLIGAIGGRVSPAMQIMLDDRLFDRARLMAKYLAEARGFVPRHLEGKTAACFAVVVNSMTWKMNPFAVARCTYETPNGQVGYMGSLVQAIIENSGMTEGEIEYEHFGDWNRLVGKFVIERKDGDEKKSYAKRTWDVRDAQGLGVRVKVQVKGERKKRVWEFLLVQAYPLFSTMWATDPKTQICYTAIRRFANIKMPGIVMGLPSEGDDLRYIPRGDDARVIEPENPDDKRTTATTAGTLIEPFALLNAQGDTLPGKHTTVEAFATALAEALGDYKTAVNRLSFFSHNMSEIERAIAERPDTIEPGGVLAPVMEAYQGAEFDVQSEAFKRAEEQKPTTTAVEEKPVDEKLPDEFPGDRKDPPHEPETGEVYDEKNPPPPSQQRTATPPKQQRAKKEKPVEEEEKKPDPPKISEADLKAHRIAVPVEDGTDNLMRWCYLAIERVKGMRLRGATAQEFRLFREANRETLARGAKRNASAVKRIEGEIAQGEASAK